MASERFSSDLELLLKSRHSIVLVETAETDRAEGLLAHLAERMKLPFSTWTRSKGLRRSFEKHIDNETLSPLAALERVETWQQRGIYNFQGLALELGDAVVGPSIAAKLRDAARQFRAHEGGIVITGQQPDELPEGLRQHLSIMEFPLPSERELRTLVETLFRDLSRTGYVEYSLMPTELDQLVRHLQGVTMLEAEKILTKAMLEDARLGSNDIGQVIDAKRRVLQEDGLLEYYPFEAEQIDVAGAEMLVAWLDKRRAVIQDVARARAFGLSFPKGVFLVGVQGSGKSLSARMVAQRWGLPLIKLDPSGLYNKYIGETERNFRRATLLAEKMAPIVLWIDEIEKAFAASGEQDGGVSQRVLGSFLSWLQERRGDVFVVATANDVSKLPPELLRKGRFDEIFFLDLPTHAARQDILAIHLRRRGRDPAAFDLDRVAEASDGYSGAELEQVVVAALYTAFARGQDISTALLLEEVAQTVPLSVTMRESLDGLRHWAAGRTVPAAA